VSKEKLKVGIIAAEHSGDRLGAKLIQSLQEIYEVDLYGLGGPAVNTSSIVTPPDIDYQDLHVMGLIDPLINLPKILSIRKKLLTFLLQMI
jgi:lipid A disaccharide synthetase